MCVRSEVIIISCNSPMLAVKDGFTSSGAVHYKVLGRYSLSLHDEYPDSIKVPCGKCRGCRASKSRAWADRMILELDHSKKAVFLTLTYNDDHVPIRYKATTGESVMSLNKRDLTLFFKRLRKRFKDKEIRYYACGEYGGRTHRPHYHVILFGLDISDFPDAVEWTSNELGDKYFISNDLSEKVWKNGFCLLAKVSWNTCAYVARYVKKKDFGLASDEFVDRLLEPEFSVMSRDPGIGMYYPKEHPNCFEYSVFHFGDNGSTVEVFLPQAFLNSLKESDPDMYDSLKAQRLNSMVSSDFSKMLQTGASEFEYEEMLSDRLNFSGKVIDFYRGL